METDGDAYYFDPNGLYVEPEDTDRKRQHSSTAYWTNDKPVMRLPNSEQA